MKHVGMVTNFLGVQIEKREELGNLSISQNDYVESLLETFSIHNSKGVDTPMTQEQQQEERKQLDVNELCEVFPKSGGESALS